MQARHRWRMPGRRALAAALAFAAGLAGAAGLPDSGQDKCYTGSAEDVVPATSASSVSRDGGSFPRQDCRFGRDAAAAAGVLTKTGGGAKGFDYTKISNSGNALAAGATLGPGANEWACTRDNVTGLLWEVKTSDPGDLRSSFNGFSWYSTDASSNGGNAGSIAPDPPNADSCNGQLSGQCNTQAYVAAVNALQLCGFNDWRLPTHRELFSLMILDGSQPSIDPDYFPNTPIAGYWSSTSDARHPENAWEIEMAGAYLNNGKSFAYAVRVVRGTGF